MVENDFGNGMLWKKLGEMDNVLLQEKEKLVVSTSLTTNVL
jgi:hypothetical protein